MHYCTLCSDNADLTGESAGVFIWCLTQNAESYKLWVSNLCLSAFITPSENVATEVFLILICRKDFILKMLKPVL